MDVTGDGSKVRCCKKQYCIGTSNVRSINQGKLEVVKQEVARVNINILGISKLNGLWWMNLTQMTIISTIVGKNPLEKWSSPHTQQKCQKYSIWMQSQKWQNDFCSFPRRTIQYYTNTSLCPKSNAEEAEVEQFYEDLQDLLKLTPQKDVLFITGDWNAKVGSQEIHGVTNKFGLGVQNEARQKLTEFCQENTLVVANTLFQQHKRKLYLWTLPDGQYWNQVDYILCSQRWRSSIQLAKTRLRADCGSDHELLIAKYRLKLK